MESEGRMMPKALKTTIKRFGGQRRRVRLTLSSGSTSVTPNDILRIRLPRGLVDLSTFGFTAKVGGVSGNKIMGGHTLIRRLGMTIGGVNVNFANNNWNHTAHAMNLASNGLEFDKGNLMSGMYPLDAAALNDRIEFNYFPLSPMGMGLLWTEATGECEVDIAFDGSEPLIVPVGGDATETWSLSEIFAYVDVIDLEDDAYPKAVASALARGQAYNKSVELATAVIQDNTATNSVNVSTGCLDKVLVAPKLSTYTTRQVQDSQQVYNDYLDFQSGITDMSGGNAEGFYVQIGGVSFPQYGHGQNFAELAQITRSCYGASPYNYNKLFIEAPDASGSLLTNEVALTYDKDRFFTNNAVCLFPVGAFHEDGSEGGIDLSSGSAVIQVFTQGSTLIARKVLIAGIHKSRVSVRAGQVVSFQT